MRWNSLPKSVTGAQAGSVGALRPGQRADRPSNRNSLGPPNSPPFTGVFVIPDRLNVWQPMAVAMSVPVAHDAPSAPSLDFRVKKLLHFSLRH